MWPMVFYFRTNKPLIYSRNVDLMQKIYVSMLFLLSLNCTDFVLLLLNAAKATATMATVADTPAMMLATTFEEAENKTNSKIFIDHGVLETPPPKKTPPKTHTYEKNEKKNSKIFAQKSPPKQKHRHVLNLEFKIDKLLRLRD